ncbi:hypothetical protein [Mesorhizobium escarrei]|uniref:hypothetical protein n=1 Tax=Mesorhizobium escarrei TaxID=666018 RepID=UPI0020A7766C|nr:hypothetical protein [Mesorhizobium escarrei]
MDPVELGGFFPLRRVRHGSVLGSPIIDALSRQRGRLGETRWFKLFALMVTPLSLFNVLAGSSTDAVTTSFLIFFAIYSDLVIALLWLTEKDGALAEPTQSHPRPKRIALCVKGRGEDHPQFPQPLDTRETHSRRGRARASARRGHD